MKSKNYSRSLVLRPHEPTPDAAVIQRRIERHIADRFRMSDPVAAVIAGLAGLGPQTREAR